MKHFKTMFPCWYQGVLYHKQIFQDCGVGIPETQEQLKEAVEVFQDRGITPFASHFQETWSVGNRTMQAVKKCPNAAHLFLQKFATLFSN